MSKLEMDEKIHKNLFVYSIIALEFVALKFHYHEENIKHRQLMC